MSVGSLIATTYHIPSCLHPYQTASSPIVQPRVYPMRFGWKAVEPMPKLKSKGQGQPKLPEVVPDGPQTFNMMSWNSDVDWSDARLKPVIVYLKGNRSLNLPDAWKAVFPSRIWFSGTPMMVLIIYFGRFSGRVTIWDPKRNPKRNCHRTQTMFSVAKAAQTHPGIAKMCFFGILIITAVLRRTNPYEPVF